MTQFELHTLLLKLDYPVRYSHFSVDDNHPAPNPPFITYLFVSSADMMADGFNFLELSNFQVELYSEKKDLAAEQKVQNLFKREKIPYQKSETWIDAEKLYQIIYTIQILGE